jgi:hypothetical protein
MLAVEFGVRLLLLRRLCWLHWLLQMPCVGEWILAHLYPRHHSEILAGPCMKPLPRLQLQNLQHPLRQVQLTAVSRKTRHTPPPSQERSPRDWKV